MKCRRARSWLVRFDEGQLPPQARQAVAAHLETCEPCREELAGLQRAVSTLRAMAAPRDPGNVPPGLAARICRQAIDASPRATWLRPAFAGAAALCALFVGGFLLAIVLGRSSHEAVIPKPVAAAPPKAAAAPALSDDLFDARLAAIKTMMAARGQAAASRSVASFVDAAALGAEIPAIMLQAADHLNYDLGVKAQAEERYSRIIRLFPQSEQAMVARDRLSQLGISYREEHS